MLEVEAWKPWRGKEPGIPGWCARPSSTSPTRTATWVSHLAKQIAIIFSVINGITNDVFAVFC